MKNRVVGILASIVTATALTGCAWQVGGGAKHATVQPTVGQQLLDLQKAKEAGAITDSEYEVQKAKVLGRK